MGGFSTLAQIVLLREVLVVLAGNELSLAVSLAAWLLGVGLGALLGGAVAARSRLPERWVWLSLLFLVAAAPASAIGVRLMPTILSSQAGAVVPPVDSLLMCLALLTPASLGVGLSFAPLARLAAPAGDVAVAAGWIYAAEAVGAVLGGVLFTFAFAGTVPALVTLVGAGSVLTLVLSVTALLRRRAGSGIVAAVVAVLGLAALVSGRVEDLDESSAVIRWRSQAAAGERVAAVDSPYQHLDLAEHEGQFDLYSNGSPTISFPDPWERAVAVHTAMVQHRSGPRRVLLVGGGVADRISGALVHGPDEVHYVTSDPAEIDLIRAFLPRADHEALSDRRVRVFLDDGRRFVRRAAAGRYDVIVVEASDPTTARSNRYFTQEFLDECRRALAPDGLLATRISGAVHLEEDAVAPEASLYHALVEVFGHVALWPGADVRFFAARDPAVVSDDPAELARRWRDRGLSAPFMSEYRFESLFEPDLVAEHRARLDALTPLPNTDAHPTAYLYGLVLWDERARGAAEPSPLWALRRVRTWWILAPLLVLAAVRLLGPRPGRRRRAADGVWMALTGGLCGLALEVMLLLVYQNAAGSLYQTLGLLVALFMLGLAAGTFVLARICRCASCERVRRIALVVDLMTVAVTMTCPLIAGTEHAAWLAGLWLVAVGLCTGAVFPPALALIEAGSRGRGARAAGLADAADHLGACLGALTVGVLVIPVAGLLGAAFVLAGVKTVSLAGLVRRPRLGRE